MLPRPWRPVNRPAGPGLPPVELTINPFRVCLSVNGAGAMGSRVLVADDNRDAADSLAVLREGWRLLAFKCALSLMG
jgi:hypothetical protein